MLGWKGIEFNFCLSVSSRGSSIVGVVAFVAGVGNRYCLALFADLTTCGFDIFLNILMPLTFYRGYCSWSSCASLPRDDSQRMEAVEREGAIQQHRKMLWQLHCWDVTMRLSSAPHQKRIRAINLSVLQRTVRRLICHHAHIWYLLF